MSFQKAKFKLVRSATRRAGVNVVVLAVAMLAAGLSGITHAEVALPTLFGENAVLQRDMPVPIWGTASPGETVTVQFNGQFHEAMADASGNWMVMLDPMSASTDPGPLLVKATNEITLRSVQIGEVWVGSGQSNMSREISRDAERELATSEALGLNLSFFNVASGSPAGTQWQDSNADTADAMSAVMFWFGRHLANELSGVPIGLIHSAVSGTAIERWSTEAGSGGLYLGQIVPLQPYAIRGVIWYQGEWDARSAKDAEKYYWQLPALISEWRADWNQGDFPFYVVQMPRMGIGKVHVIRDAELQAALAMDYVEMTVNIDYPEIDVHPSGKRPFGRRLADIALKTIHGQAIPAFSPVYDHAQSYVSGSEVYVGFNHVENGLVARDGPLAEWEIAGADGNYVDADARVDGNHVVVSSAVVPNPVSVRYAFEPAPANPNLFNSVVANEPWLPASPIRELMLPTAPDGDAPTPNPMTWESLPSAISDSSISMTATVASDPSGVEYYFACANGACSDSGWRDSVTYLDTGLQPGTEYSYQVQARDKSANQNPTGFSTTESATTLDACVPESIGVASIVLSKENAGQGAKRARAEVTVIDSCNAHVEGATVFGAFTGDYYNYSGSAVTDVNGIAVMSTVNAVKGKASFQFCVTDIVSGGLSYSPGPLDCKSL